ncbi:hypothetical protein ACFV3R_00590 [Streptomyces sp. NPDC059740]|uniref:hypothetical protein n=1 Tax=Streptomyces sp. NPDC059740 TaxID=3346926 RepID=UPI00365360EE
MTDMSSTPPAQPPVPGPPPAGRKPSRRKAWLTHGATALVALLFGAAIGGGGESGAAAGSSSPAPAVTVTRTAAGEPEPAVTVTETVTAKPKPVKKSGPPSSFSGEGQYLVGEDIQAGTYRTSGPEKDSIIPNCYWARLKDASGELTAIIANDNIQGQGRVTVNKGEYFKTSGCQEWQKVG